MLTDFQWYNVYSHADPVTAYLDFYDVNEQRARHYWHHLLKAHLAYWKDPGFYDVALEWLTHSQQAEPAPLDKGERKDDDRTGDDD